MMEMEKIMHDFMAESIYLGVMLTLGTYCIGLWIKKISGWTLLNPLLVSIVLSIGFLFATGTSYESYAKGGNIINYLLKSRGDGVSAPVGNLSEKDVEIRDFVSLSKLKIAVRHSKLVIVA